MASATFSPPVIREPGAVIRSALATSVWHSCTDRQFGCQRFSHLSGAELSRHANRLERRRQRHGTLLRKGCAIKPEPGLPSPVRARRCFRGSNRAWVPAVYASRTKLPSPMQDSLPAGGLRRSPTGSHPLSHVERDQHREQTRGMDSARNAMRGPI